MMDFGGGSDEGASLAEMERDVFGGGGPSNEKAELAKKDIQKSKLGVREAPQAAEDPGYTVATISRTHPDETRN